MERRQNRVVVVGGGQAGHQVAASLRERGYEGDVTLVCGEDELPYERPPLSKSYLQGAGDESRLWLRPETYYARHSIERVTAFAVDIDRAGRTALLDDGGIRGYDHLVLATGARARTLQAPGSGLKGIRTLRTLADARLVRAELAEAAHVVVIGAGFIGLEFAASARESGCEVTIVEARERPLMGITSTTTAAHLLSLQHQRGVESLFQQSVTAFHGRDGRVAAVELSDGRRLPADLVLVGVGVTPDTRLAEAAGLTVDGGIVTDSHLLTSDPGISAVGDCAVFPSPRTGTPVRIESVQNAADQARLVAARLTGSSHPYEALPWFWSKQFGTSLQIAGLGQGFDAEVYVVDSPDAFSVLLFRGDELLAVESVNRPADHLAARRLLDNRIPLSRRDATAADFSLSGHLKAHTGGSALAAV
nr:FAD/NAD(P)-binding oxidoreductase [Streptacidiphilus pinicola]